MSDGLFDVAELVPSRAAGRVEAGTHKALEKAWSDGVLTDLDAGLASAALVAARTLDRAEGLPDAKAVYAVAQNMRPYQDAMQALRLPPAVAPVGTPRLPDAPAAGQDAPDWLSDELGPS